MTNTRKKLRKIRREKIKAKAREARAWKPEPNSPADEYRFGVRSKR